MDECTRNPYQPTNQPTSGQAPPTPTHTHSLEHYEAFIQARWMSAHEVLATEMVKKFLVRSEPGLRMEEVMVCIVDTV